MAFILRFTLSCIGLALVSAGKGLLLHQKVGSDSPDSSAPYQTSHERDDGGMEVTYRLPASAYESASDETAFASEEPREELETNEESAHTHRNVEEEELAKESVFDEMKYEEKVASKELREALETNEEFVHTHRNVGEEELAKFVIVPVDVAIIAALFLGASVARMKWNWLPESAITITIGVILGIWMKATMGRIPFFNDEEVFNETCAIVLNLFLLPILMFEAGWSMRYKDFASQFTYIMLFAVVGSLLSFLTVGYLIYVTGQMGWHSVKYPRAAFVYASLIAATDPVATLATYTELKVDALLNILVFGDSIFNDAVAIVLFKVLNSDAIMGTVDSRPSLHQLAEYITLGIGSIFFGSVAVGLAVGAVFLLTLRFLHMKKSPRLEVLALIALSYCCFSLAEAVEMSGIIATMFCSMLIGLYGRPHLSNSGSMLGTYFLQQMARLMDTSVFILVGFCLVNLGEKGLVFGAWVMAFCLLGRAASVFPIAVLCNGIKKAIDPRCTQLISPQTMFMMWHAGLRGAISLTLAMQLGPWVDRLEGPGTRHIMQTGTYILIIVFLFVFGGSTKYFLTRCKIPMEVKKEDSPPDKLYNEELTQSQKNALMKVNGVLMPFFVGKPAETGDKRDFENEPEIEDVLKEWDEQKSLESLGKA